MERIKVAHVITKLAVGGAQESALVTLDGLDPTDFDQWLVSGTEVDEEGSLRDVAVAQGANIVDLPELVRSVSPATDRRAVLALRDHFRSTRPDIVHTHSSKAGMVGRLAARLARVPVVVHSVHGWSFHPEMPRLTRMGVVIAERIAARATSVLVHEAVPDKSKGLARGIGRPGQYVLIRNGIDLDDFGRNGVEPGAVRRSLGIPDDAWVMGTVGRLADQKAPLSMVEAVAPLLVEDSRAWFVWVGDGPLRERTAELAARAGVSERFVLAGVRRDVPAVLRALDVFALSSLWEGLPRTVTEAMASGCPVVAAAVDGVAEVIDHGRNGLLVPPHDPLALREGLRRIRRDEALRTTLIDAGRGRSADFDRVEMQRKLSDLYRSLVAGRPVERGHHAHV